MALSNAHQQHATSEPRELLTSGADVPRRTYNCSLIQPVTSGVCAKNEPLVDLTCPEPTKVPGVAILVVECDPPVGRRWTGDGGEDQEEDDEDRQ